MSTMVRYEIRVEVPEAVPGSVTRMKLCAALRTCDGCYFDPACEIGTASHVSIFDLHGEESDWSRPHIDRHNAVVSAVRSVLPTARVTTSWLNTEVIEWDDSFDTNDEDNDGDEAEA